MSVSARLTDDAASCAQMMAHQLADVRSRGQPVAILWASEGSIYQRFGYGLATLAGTFDITSNRTAFRTATPDAPGDVRLVEREEAARLLPPVYDVVRAATPGFLSRSPDWWAKEVLVDPGVRPARPRPQVLRGPRTRREAGRVRHLSRQARMGRRWLAVAAHHPGADRGRCRRSARDVALRLRDRPDRSRQEPIRAAGSAAAADDR